MMLDPKGLEAAYDAGRDYVMKMDDRTKQMLRVSISAYLSTITPAEVGGLVAELRDEDFRHEMQHLRSSSEIDRLFQAAASLIQSQAAESERWRAEYLNAASDAQKFAARIAELEAGLRPFAQRCDEAVRLDDGDNDGVAVKTKHLRTARALLNGERKG